MSSHSQVTSPLPNRQDPPINGLVRTRGVERDGGSGSESDWTGDDWTGASSDSAFINYIRSQHQLHHCSPRVSPSPVPTISGTGDGIYMGLSPHTLNHDNQYCSVDRLHPVAAHSPTPNRPSGPTPLDSVAELGESLTEEDEYCKMVPNASIRAELMKQPPLSPLAGRRPLPPTPTHRSPSDPVSPLPQHRHSAPTIKNSPSDPMLRQRNMSAASYRQAVPVGRSNSEMQFNM